MSKDEMSKKIQNAVFGIGAEEAVKTPPKFMRVGMEWKTFIFRLPSDDIPFDAAGHPRPINSPLTVENTLTNLLNEDWVISREIICSPFVILIFWREKKEGEKPWPEA